MKNTIQTSVKTIALLILMHGQSVNAEVPKLADFDSYSDYVEAYNSYTEDQAEVNRKRMCQDQDEAPGIGSSRLAVICAYGEPDNSAKNYSASGSIETMYYSFGAMFTLVDDVVTDLTVYD